MVHVSGSQLIPKSSRPHVNSFLRVDVRVRIRARVRVRVMVRVRFALGTVNCLLGEERKVSDTFMMECIVLMFYFITYNWFIIKQFSCILVSTV